MSDQRIHLDTKQAAQYLGVAPKTLENWRSQDSGPPYYKFGKGHGARVAYNQAELDTWLSEHRVIPRNQVACG